MMRAIEEGIDFVGGKKDGMLSPTFLSCFLLILPDISVVVGVIGLNEKKLELKT